METKNRKTHLYAANPGGILKDEIEERKIPKSLFAKKLGLLPSHLSELFNGKRRFTITIAERIEKELGIPARTWIGLQKDRDIDLKVIEKRRRTKKVDQVVKKILRDAEYFGAVDISPLFLQKMLYYQQGYHLARFGTPLFSEEIEAWRYGPVVPSVYKKYKRYGDADIPMPETDSYPIFAPEEEELFTEVYEKFCKCDAFELMKKTHEEKPWQEAIKKGLNTEITQKALKDFFSKQ